MSLKQKVADYLTSQFVFSVEHCPEDECYDEAEKIINMVIDSEENLRRAFSKLEGYTVNLTHKGEVKGSFTYTKKAIEALVDNLMERQEEKEKTDVNL